MVSRSLAKRARWVLVLLIVLAASVPAFAEPTYKKLKKDIDALEAKSATYEKAVKNADAALTTNQKAQRSASGKELEALKTEATQLARTAAEKASALREHQQKIANKQGELRKEAAKYAVSRLTANGDAEDRMSEAIVAVEDWKEAMGSLPKVPEVVDTAGIVDPGEKLAVKKDNKERLQDFDDWAKDEESRIEDEIKQADELSTSNKAVGNDGVELKKSAKALKKTLETRLKNVGKLRDTAKARLRQLG